MFTTDGLQKDSLLLQDALERIYASYDELTPFLDDDIDEEMWSDLQSSIEYMDHIIRFTRKDIKTLQDFLGE